MPDAVVLLLAASERSEQREHGERVLPVGVARDRLVEPGDVEHSFDLVADTAEREAAISAEPLPGLDEQRDTGRIDELAAAEVDQEWRVRRAQGLLHLPLELGRRVHVQLSLDEDHERAGLLLVAYSER